MTRSLTPPQRSDTAHIFRHILLLLAAVGSVGTFLELVLTGHYETPTQWPPLVLLLLSLVGIVVVWVKPTARALRLFRWLMIVVTLSSLVGVYFHMQSNFASVLERTPDLSWTAQLWQAMQGRNPLLSRPWRDGASLVAVLSCDLPSSEFEQSHLEAGHLNLPTHLLNVWRCAPHRWLSTRQ